MANFILITGYVTVVIALLITASLCLEGICKLINRGVRALLDTYGGIETFKEYRHWYWNVRKQDENNHSDNSSVDILATAMKSKLEAKRKEGRGGWETATPEYLSQLLHEHVTKGDPVDVANLCMMLFCLNSKIQQPKEKESKCQT